MSRPTIEDGAVAVSAGHIVDLGRYQDVQVRAPSAAYTEDLGEAALLPGLVNAHVHLELSDLAPGPSPGSFVEWLARVIKDGPPGSPDGEQRVGNAVRQGIAECLQFGVTSVGDITRFPAITRRALADSPLQTVSFGEVTAMASRRGLLGERLGAAMTPPPPRSDGVPARIVSAVSPHAPYSVEPAGFLACLEAAKAADVPIATHLCESPDEKAFLEDHEGPFRQLWDRIGGWDESVPKVQGGPVNMADHAGLLRYARTLLVHVNYLSEFEQSWLECSSATVAICPRTHAYFKHAPHPWRRMMERGIPLCVGTDSKASSPDLNLVDDLRLLHRQVPDLSARQLWDMATLTPAIALGLQYGAGDIRVGGAADLTAFRTEGPSPLTWILEHDVLPTATWAMGRRFPP